MRQLFSYIIVLGILICASCQDDGISFDDEQHNPQDTDTWFSEYDTSGSVGGHYYVDLGLSVLWSTSNIGASNPLMSGSYFAWGETAPKDSYTWETYSFSDKDDNLLKYNYDKKYSKDGLVDSIYTLKPEDDAAVQNWGQGWRMPTAAEFEELRNQCNWEWVSSVGMNYYKVTGPNGKSIIFPACGCIKDRERIMYALNGCLWTSNLSINIPQHGYELTQYATGYWMGSADRFYGEPIRPVIKAQDIKKPSKN